MRCAHILATMILLGTVSGAFCLDEAEIGDLFGQAKEYFRQANDLVDTDPEGARELYQKAVIRFERIVREGAIENGKLYYNIGNSYFRMKDIGRAVLNYRRAEQYIPNDPNLHQNLEYARRRRVDSIEEQQKTRVLKTLFFWHYDVSTRARALIFTGSFALLWCCAIVRLYVRRAALGWAIGLLGAVSLLLLGSLTAEMMHLKTVNPGVILAAEVVARKGDSDTYEPSFKEALHAGSEFILVEDRGEWYHVELTDGRRCWVPVTSIGLVR